MSLPELEQSDKSVGGDREVLRQLRGIPTILTPGIHFILPTTHCASRGKIRFFSNFAVTIFSSCLAKAHAACVKNHSEYLSYFLAFLFAGSVRRNFNHEL